MLAQTIKVKKIRFYFTIILIHMAYLIDDYESIEEHYSFYLIYDTICCSSLLVSYEGKTETTPARVKCILICYASSCYLGITRSSLTEYDIHKSTSHFLLRRMNYLFSRILHYNVCLCV